jgi:NADPH:quinone reductase-like Zn-dependent oxidoreductase
MRELGADAGVNYRSTPNWYEGVMALTGGRGADLVVNSVGLQELDNCLEACRSGGRVSYIGATPVTSDRLATTPGAPKRLGLLIVRDLTIKGILVGSRRMMEDLVAALGEHPEVRPIVDRVYEFEQANEALEYFAGAQKIGKVVIRTRAPGPEHLGVR